MPSLLLPTRPRSPRLLSWLPAAALLAATPLPAVDSAAPTAVLDVPSTLQAGSPLQLSGARSTDVGGRVDRYRWTRLEGGGGGGMPVNQTVETLASSYLVPQPAGNALAPGRHRFRLVVVDDSGNQSSPVEALLVVQDTLAPTAVLAVPGQVVQGQAFSLSGAQSSDAGGGRVVRYRWTRVAGGAGGPMPLNQPVETPESSFAVQQTTANPLAAGSHTFRLVVVDDSGNQSSSVDAAVAVRAVDNTAPTAVLDLPSTLQAGSPLQLSGARSTDVGGRVDRYRWTRLEGGGGGGMPVNQTVETLASSYLVPQPAGNALAPGRHRFRLVVVDDSGNQSSPVEALLVVQDTLAPTAVLAVPGQVVQGQAFSLSGAQSSDAGGGRVVRYRWTRVAGGAGGPMPLNQPVETPESSFAVQQTTANPLAAGNHTFRLVVVDDSGNQSSSVDAAVAVRAVDNTAPTAVLDLPSTLQAGSPLRLSGARSTDVGGRVHRYQWTRLEGTGGDMPVNQTVVTETSFYLVPQPARNPLSPGRHRFRLVVVDDSGNQSSPVEALVNVPSGGLQ